MEMMMNGQSADSGCGAPCMSPSPPPPRVVVAAVVVSTAAAAAPSPPSLAAAAGFAIEVRARRAVCARASPSSATWRGCRQTVFR